MNKKIEKQIHDFAEMCYTEAYNDGKADALSDSSSDILSARQDGWEKGMKDAWECARKLVLDATDGGFPASTVRKLFDGKGWHQVLKEYGCGEVYTKIKEYEESFSKEEIKEGTRVRTTKNITRDGDNLFPIGTIGVITQVDGDDDELPYKVDANNDYRWYSRDMFEVIPEDEILVGDEAVLTYGRTVIISRVGNYNNDWYAIFKDGSSGCITKGEIQKRTGRHFPQIAEVFKQMSEVEE